MCNFVACVLFSVPKMGRKSPHKSRETDNKNIKYNMKKYLFILASSAALVACSKNELTPAASVADQEITYTVAPKVKALTTGQIEFDKKWTFKSTAFYLANRDADNATQTWPTNAAASTVYINGVDISWNTDVWRNADKHYYWPKDGALTFFAWTSLKQNPDAALTASISDSKAVPAEDLIVSNFSGVEVTKDKGIVIKDYDVKADGNKNYDILVADTKINMTKNDNTPVYLTTGVPTLFKHKLSQVFFTVQTVESEDPTKGHDYTTTEDNIKFEVTSITFKSIDTKNTFTQTNAEGAAGSWSTTASDITESDQIYTNTKTEVTEDAAVLIAAGNYYYYLPQNFDAPASGAAATKDYIEVKYDITYNVNDTATETVEHMTKNIVLNGSVFDKWEMGKRYTINLRFSLDEILWDPAVEDWGDETKTLDF